MILHIPKKTKEGKAVQISACFELETPFENLPPTLWYRFPERYSNKVSTDSNAFAPTALLVAMYAGEGLTIQGNISPCLAYHLEEYKTVLCTWYPRIFKPIEIDFERIAYPSEIKGKRAVATAFSGGVDSFYTTWAHLSENQPIIDAQLTHGLFVHGLDMRLANYKNYQDTTAIYKDLFYELGIELIEGETNAYQFSEFRIDWSKFFGAPTIGAALALSPWLRRLYMPSGTPSYEYLSKNSSSPVIDHLLSTEKIEIVHHGASLVRMQKASILVKWPITYNKLRVCSNKNITTVENCSKCHKCYRTMIILDLLNALPKYQNFSQKIRFWDYFRWGAFTLLGIDIAILIRNQALKLGRLYVALGIQIAILLRFVSKTIREIPKRLLPKEQLYHIKRRIYKPESTSQELAE